VPAEGRDSLAELGIEMARSAGLPGDPWSAPEARDALRAVEDFLGVVGHEAIREILFPEPEPRWVPERDFPADALHRFLDGDHLETRQAIFALLQEPAFRFPLEMDGATYRTRVLDAVQELARRGYGSLAFPEEYGGAGNLGRSIAVFETLAHGDLSVLVKFGVQFGLFGGSVLQLGTERHHRRYLQALGKLELPGCYAMTERGHGSNVRDLETVARFEPSSGEFVVHTPHDGACKEWIGNAALHGRIATVFAQLVIGDERHGVHAFLVPIREGDGTLLPGVRIEDCGPKEGLNGVDNGRIWFDHVRIPRENLLDRFGTVTPEGEYSSPIPGAGRRFFTMLGTLVAGRISIAAASLASARTALTIAVRYSEARRQFGPAGAAEVPILDYLSQQRALLPRLATTYGLTFALRHLIRRHGDAEGGDAREVEVMAAGLKAYASRHNLDTLQACREACGGQGYLAANRFAALRADTDVFTTFEGANVVLLLLVSKGLLSRFNEEMGDLKLWGMVKYLADRAGTRVAELNPIVTRRTDEDHLLDPELHTSAFEYREEWLLASAGRRLKTLIDAGVDSFDAMNACQDHLVSLAMAHTERVVLLHFQDAVMRAPSPLLSEVLRTLASLYALSRIDAHKGWYLESGYMEPAKTRAIRTMVNRLCGEVREQAVPLVDAFGIPDAVLRAPAAFASP
jgi:acyl-CoA oxidase